MPALLLACFGGLMWLDIADRQALGRDLQSSGVEVVAGSVKVNVAGGRGTPLISGIRVAFRDTNGRVVSAKLTEFEDDAQGMPEGVHIPAPGTRYAKPLTLLYLPSEPETVLASVDAQEWLADQETHATPR
ncbi:hypothetical protein [Kribbella deserti]|uniref:Carboxypeptidase regulatory-like domain-containing protein n=1 Tax=Kribbella deserti TaxID=1926257 RepID=A0ABV6QSU5_9ACTN